MEAGAEVELWTLNHGRTKVPGVTVRGFATSQELAASLRELDPKSTFLHDNGLWLPFNMITCSAAKSAGIPYAISPRGMLDPLSLKQSFWKKKIAWYLYQRRLLAGATLVHATSELEASGIRKAGFGEKVVVLSNGIELPPFPNHSLKLGNTVLYLSRLHPQKGVEVLLNAWAAIAPRGWHLKIAGGGERGYVEALKRLSVQLGIEKQVVWVGPVEGMQKGTAFGRADFFVLPSFSESFGIVVAEALASGLPVVTTTGTPWRDLEKRGCGIAVAPTKTDLAWALGKFMQFSIPRRSVMGNIGRALMMDKYSWSNIAKEMLGVYSSIVAKANA